jgi:hypothetical protein
MEQQAELALADLPVAPPPLRAVVSRPAGLAELAAPVPIHVPTIRTLFPATHHAHPDRSALGRGRGLWAAAKRAAELGRGHTASRLWSRRTANLWPPATALTGPEAVIPVDRFVAYLEELAGWP